MPGIVAKVTCGANTSIESDVAAMLRAMTHHPSYVVESWNDGTSRQADAPTQCSVGLGRVSLGFVNRVAQPVTGDGGAWTAVMEGEVYDYRQRRLELEREGVTFEGESHAELLAIGCRRLGQEFLRRIHGMFVAVLWDAEQQQLRVVNDRFGMKVFYYAHDHETFAAASEIKALEVDTALPRTEDLTGVAQFFTFGQLLSDRTMLESVHALPPAAWLTYDARRDTCHVERYWRLPAGYSAGDVPSPSAIDALDGAFVRAVDRCSQDTDHLGLALSGGLDARSILAVIDPDKTPVRTISLGIDGSLDHRCAAALAGSTHRDHHEFMLDASVCDPEAFGETLHRVAHLTDGHTLDQGIVMPMLPVLRELGIEVLLRGHAGELMHMNKAYNLSLDDEAWAIDSENALEQWLYTRLSSWMRVGGSEPILARATRDETEALLRDSLRSCLAESEHIDVPVHRIWHFFLTQRLPRETALSLAQIGSRVETRIPILDPEIIELLIELPPEMKVGETLQTEILRRHRPEFLKVVNANTGAPVGASALRQRFSTLRMKVFAKLGVPGYQPYERLGLWLRRELKPLVRSLLLDERCLDRGVLCADTVRTVVDQHWQGQDNHTFLMMAMMIYELSHRPSGPGSP